MSRFLLFTLPYLKKSFDKITNQLFYRDVYKQLVLKQLTDSLAAAIDLQTIARESLKLLTGVTRPTGAHLAVTEDNLAALQTSSGKTEVNDFTIEQITTIVRQREQLIFLEGIKVKSKKPKNLSSSVALLKLKTKEGSEGFLLLGPKQNGDIFNSQNRDLLAIGSKNLASSLRNAKHHNVIRQFAITLQQEVNRATKKLKQSNKRQHNLPHTKDGFISMASCQPLPQLIANYSFTELIEKAPSETAELIPTIKANTKRMESLAKDMMNVTHIQRGEFKIDKQPADIAELISLEARNLYYLAKKHNIQIVFDPAVQPVVAVDANKFREAIYNLLENAVFYNRKGGEVAVELESSHDGYKLTIRGQSIGTPRVNQAKIFRKLYRVPNAQSACPAGSGIGLYIPKTILDVYASPFALSSSSLGRGTTWTTDISAFGEGL